MLYKEVHSLVFHGRGGFTWDDVYSMPVWVRRYLIALSNEVQKQEEEQRKAANSKQSTDNPKPPFKGLKKPK